MFQKHHKALLIISFFIFFISCKNDENPATTSNGGEQLTLFFVNDMHGQLDNFAKIKHIVDAEKAMTNTLLVSAGDIFSGSPIVDQYTEKGFPIIDVMSKTGFDVSVLGNHEFDYGLSVLNDRMNQADFDWVCANVDTEGSVLMQPDAFVTLRVGELTVTFLGLVETNGKPDDIIPSTHPWRVADLTFQPFIDVLDDYRDLKEEEGADVLVALTHLGSFSDFLIANEYPYFDVIIGGHSNDLNDGTENGIPVVMAGSHLSHLGKIELTIRHGAVVSHETSLIKLDEYPDKDEVLTIAIEEYNNAPQFSEIIGFANSHHGKNELGCFYTTALREYMQTDISFQNGGGIRSDIAAGDISVLDIYNMDPFNNGSVIFTMTASEIKDFFIETRAGLHVTGVSFEQSGSELMMFDEGGSEINDNVTLTIGTNDFIPAVYDSHFPFEQAEVLELTTAETIIQYLKTVNSTVDYENCNSFFRYN